MKILQKFVSTILIISIISSLAWNIFLFKPKEAKATDLGGSWASFLQGLLENLKELVLDVIPKVVARTLMVKLQKDLIRWAQGGFSKQNKPFVMREWKEELLNAVDTGTGIWLEKYNLTNMCQPIRVTLEIGTYLTNYNYQTPSYPQTMACTFTDIFENAEDFWKNPTLTFVARKDQSAFGDPAIAFNAYWRPWLHSVMPAGSMYMAYLETEDERNKEINSAVQNKEKEVVTNQGYLNDGTCNKTEGQDCEKICRENYPPEFESPAPGIPAQQKPNPNLEKCLKNCEKKAGLGICIDRTITKLGSTIKAGIDKTVGSDMDWLISADEISELIGIFFSALLTKAMHGAGFIATGPGTFTYKAANQSKKPGYKETYGYFRASRSTMNMSSLKDLRTQVSSNIFDNIGSMRSAVQCSGDPKQQQMRIEQLAESLPEMLEGEVQELYTGLNMVDLKPDYKVLDPPGVSFAFSVYGTTWDETPYAIYPPACAVLTKEFGENKTCKDIVTNLPYELDITRVNSVCTATCLTAIAESREDCSKVRDDCVYTCSQKPASIPPCEDSCHTKYNTCATQAIDEAINRGKCLTIPGGVPSVPGGSVPGGGAGGCFLAGTKILIADGSSKNVEDIKIGDKVLSFDDKNNLTVKAVSKLFPSLVDDYYILKTENHQASVTGRHRFYIGNGFKPVKDLSIGDRIYVLEKGKLTPEKIIHKELIKKQVKVYNFKVEATQTYFANGFAVHNTKEACAGDEWYDSTTETCKRYYMMQKLEEPMTPFEEIFKPETKANSMPLSLGQIIGSNPAIEECLTGAELIQNTENRCGQCIKEVESGCESEPDPAIRETCIKGLKTCYDEEDAFYTNITATGVPPITDGLDFYNRCSKAQKRDACYVCLMEYFVPASYCQQVLDYMSRGFIKYPVVTYIENLEKSWVVKIFTSSTFLIGAGAGIGFMIGGPLGGLIGAGVAALFGWLTGGGKHKPDPGNWWIGWYDKDSGCANNKDAPKDQIPAGLICRGFAEFKPPVEFLGLNFPGGTDICKSWCAATDKERKDLTDFEPTDADCGGRKIGEAIAPQAIIAAGVFKARTKCCAALAGDEKTYRACRFGEKVSTIGTTPTEPYPCEELCRSDYRECMNECSRERAASADIKAGPTGIGGYSDGPITLEESGDCTQQCDDELSLCLEGCIEEAECGNSKVETGEVCDNGMQCLISGTMSNCTSDTGCDSGSTCITRSGDGCSANCLSNETCGNGYLDILLGEVCDDGNTTSGDGCSATCKSECGDGVVNSPGEVCDDGNTTSGDGCSANCLSNETCGNGYLDTVKGEECDDGNTAPGDGCSNICKLESCEGTPTPCSSYGNQSACENQEGCSWLESLCAGMAKDCSLYYERGACFDQEGCEWIIPM